MAERVERLGDKAESENHRLTSGSYYLRAAIYISVASDFSRRVMTSSRPTVVVLWLLKKELIAVIQISSASKSHLKM